MTSIAKIRRELEDLPWICFARLHRQHAFVLLLLLDVVFIALHIGRSLARNLDAPFGGLDQDALALDLEGSYPELYQQAKMVAIAALLVRAASSTGAPIYLALAGTFACLALDDALALHEQAGIWLAEALGLSTSWGVDGGTLGEVLFLSGAGAALLLLLIVGVVMSEAAHLRSAGLFAVPLAAFVFFGGVLDVVHVVGRGWFKGANLMLTVVEDGGEMLAMTIAFGLAWGLVRCAAPAAANEGHPA